MMVKTYESQPYFKTVNVLLPVDVFVIDVMSVSLLISDHSPIDL